MSPFDEDKIGEKAVRDGIIPPDRVNWCLDLRGRVRQWGIHPPGIGEIARAKGWITKGEIVSLYGLTAKPIASAAAAWRTTRARAAGEARRRAGRNAGLFLLFAVLAAAAAFLLEIKLSW